MLPQEVCFIAGTLGQGGAERQLFYILRSLKQSGVRLRVLSLTRGEFWENKIRELDIEVAWVGQQRSKAMRLNAIVKALREYPPIVLQSQHLFTNLYAVAAARVLGLREIGALRNDWVPQIWRRRIVTSLNLRTPRILAVNSKVTIKNIAATGVPIRQMHYLPNVVETDYFQPITRKNGETIRLLAVGRLDNQKRFDRFLSLLTELRRTSQKDIKGIIVGSGPLRPSLEKQASEQGLLPNGLEFRGTVMDMKSVYQEADILVLTSDFEGTPNVVLEAMASGLPVVATRVGGLPEIIRHGDTGYLVETDSLNGTTELLLSLINDFELRREVGSRARKYVESEHSLHRLPALLENLYTQALS